MPVSENIEMYLVMIALLSEDSPGNPVPLGDLAEELLVQTVSVNQMVRKLDEDELVKYFPYKGVQLTKKGSLLAQQIIRHRRLWEVFFVEYLAFSPSEADELACMMEHHTTSKVSVRLSKMLKHPIVSPLGKVIPKESGEVQDTNLQILSTLQAGEKAEIISLNTDKISTEYLQSQNLKPGNQIQIQAISNHGGVLISTKDTVINLNKEIAEKIIVQI